MMEYVDVVFSNFSPLIFSIVHVGAASRARVNVCSPEFIAVSFRSLSSAIMVEKYSPGSRFGMYHVYFHSSFFI